MNALNLICHRRKDRSFIYKGHQFPVCARCTGLYISIVAYIIFLCFFDLTDLIRILGILFIFPILIDGFTQFFKLRESNNKLRFGTGLTGGFGLFIAWEMFLKFLVQL